MNGILDVLRIEEIRSWLLSKKLTPFYLETKFKSIISSFSKEKGQIQSNLEKLLLISTLISFLTNKEQSVSDYDMIFKLIKNEEDLDFFYKYSCEGFQKFFYYIINNTTKDKKNLSANNIITSLFTQINQFLKGFLVRDDGNDSLQFSFETISVPTILNHLNTHGDKKVSFNFSSLVLCVGGLQMDKHKINIKENQIFFYFDCVFEYLQAIIEHELFHHDSAYKLRNENTVFDFFILSIKSLDELLKNIVLEAGYVSLRNTGFALVFDYFVNKFLRMIYILEQLLFDKELINLDYNFFNIFGSISSFFKKEYAESSSVLFEKEMGLLSSTVFLYTCEDPEKWALTLGLQKDVITSMWVHVLNEPTRNSALNENMVSKLMMHSRVLSEDQLLIIFDCLIRQDQKLCMISITMIMVVIMEMRKRGKLKSIEKRPLNNAPMLIRYFLSHELETFCFSAMIKSIGFQLNTLSIYSLSILMQGFVLPSLINKQHSEVNENEKESNTANERAIYLSYQICLMTKELELTVNLEKLIHSYLMETLVREKNKAYLLIPFDLFFHLLNFDFPQLILKQLLQSLISSFSLLLSEVSKETVDDSTVINLFKYKSLLRIIKEIVSKNQRFIPLPFNIYDQGIGDFAYVLRQTSKVKRSASIIYSKESSVYIYIRVIEVGKRMPILRSLKKTLDSVCTDKGSEFDMEIDTLEESDWEVSDLLDMPGKVIKGIWDSVKNN